MIKAPILNPLRRSAADAEAYARVVHVGQVDKAGRPYVEHLERVAARVSSIVRYGAWKWTPEAGDELLQIGWLHDVIEDEKASADDLQEEGFSLNVIVPVTTLAKPKWQPYAAYIQDIVRERDLPTLLVKLADMEDNSDPARLALLPAETRTRLERKYGPAIEMVRAAVERLSPPDPITYSSPQGG